jgi:dTDP-glucose pyrophosphorylase
MIIILPMAGRGSRFEGHGYQRPKPLILVNGVPMFIKSLASIKGLAYSKLVIVALKEHEQAFGISQYVQEYGLKDTELVLIEEVTQGQLCTVLASKDYINVEEDILIIGSDTIVNSSIGEDIGHKDVLCKGLISVADMPGDRWSFAAVDGHGKVYQVAEKQRISPHASTGMYYFSNGKEFVSLSEEMIRNKETTKGEYYVIPVYQKMIAKGERVGISKASAMWDLGTPDALNEYLNLKAGDN